MWNIVLRERANGRPRGADEPGRFRVLTQDVGFSIHDRGRISLHDRRFKPFDSIQGWLNRKRKNRPAPEMLCVTVKSPLVGGGTFELSCQLAPLPNSALVCKT